MRLSKTHALILAAAVAAVPMAALPAAAQDSGVSVTIRKSPSYLNTRTTPRPGSTSLTSYNTSAVYQPFYAQRNSISFSRGPLPSTFDLPGY